MDDILSNSSKIINRGIVVKSSYGRKLRSIGCHDILLMCFSLAYGFVLQSLPFLQFLDRKNYLNYAEKSHTILAYYANNGLLEMLVNEPLWLLVNVGLAQFFDPEIVVRVVIFLGAFFLSYSLIRVNPRNSIWLILFLLMPLLLKNHITHLRQGLAMAVFYSGFFIKRPFSRWALMIASSFIHASFFFILPIVLLSAIFKKLKFSVGIRFLVIVGFSVTVSLFLGEVASFVAARQMKVYDFEMGSVSGAGLLFWMMIGSLFLIQGKKFLTRNEEAAGVLLFYLVSYSFIEVAARVFESGIPLVLLAGLCLTEWRRWVFVSSVLFYSAFQWFLRLSLPMPF